MEKFMIYGANGFVGEAISRMAVSKGLSPVLAGRNAKQIHSLGNELNLDSIVLDLGDAEKLSKSLKDVAVVLNCAGPYLHTFKNMVSSCIDSGTHYLDLTGEISVYEAIAKLDKEAKLKNVMLLPGIGFDVVPTDCLALTLKENLSSGNDLILGFHSDGPAGLPPGTQNTLIEVIPEGNRIRKNGKLVVPPKGIVTKMIDFGNGPVEAVRVPWGDVFTAYYSTGVQNIEVFAALSKPLEKQLRLIDKYRRFLGLPVMQKLLKMQVKKGPAKELRDQTKMHVWGQLSDNNGNIVEGRIHGPEGGLDWTVLSSINAVIRVISGDYKPGYQTPASAFGSNFVLDCDGVEREPVKIINS